MKFLIQHSFIIYILFASIKASIATAKQPEEQSKFPSGLQLITEGSKQPNDLSKIILQDSQHRYEFSFQKDVKCNEIKANDKPIWKKGSRGVDLPTSVTYINDLNQLIIRNENTSLIYHKHRNGRFHYTHSLDKNGDLIRCVSEDGIAKTKNVMMIIFQLIMFLINIALLGLLIFQLRIVRQLKGIIQNKPNAAIMA